MTPEDEAPARVLVEPLERGVLDGVRELEGEAQRIRVDLGLIPVFSDERPLLGLAGLIDWRTSGRLSALIRDGLCSNEVGEQVLTLGDRRLPVDRLVVMGLGRREDFDAAGARSAAQRLVDTAVALRARGVLIALPSRHIERQLAEELFEALIGAVRAALEPEPEPEPEPELGEEGAVEPAVDGSVDAPEVSLSTDESTAGEGAPELGSTETGPEIEHAQSSRNSEPRPRAPARWWVVADEQVVTRLRRVLSGPPRPAGVASSLHT